MAVLVAYDGSDPAREALEHAFRVHDDEAITVLHVITPSEHTAAYETGPLVDWDDVVERGEAEAADLFEGVRDLPGADDVDLETATVVGHPARGIVDFAEENDIDHIVLGSHGRTGVSRILLGSVAEQVVRRAPGVVTVVR